MNCCSKFDALIQHPDYEILSYQLVTGDMDVGIKTMKGSKPGFFVGSQISIPKNVIHTCHDYHGRKLYIEFKPNKPYFIYGIQYHPSLDIYLYELAPLGRKHLYYFVEDAFDLFCRNVQN